MILKILIQVPDNVKAGEFKTIYHNLIAVDDSLLFDYSALLKGLNLLYPYPNKIITFKILNYERKKIYR